MPDTVSDTGNTSVTKVPPLIELPFKKTHTINRNNYIEFVKGD